MENTINKFDRTGIILYVTKYEACVDFYKNILGLKILFDTKVLTCFEFGNAYLMVELDDEKPNDNELQRIKTCLRMNASNVKYFAEKLSNHNIPVNYQEHSWGTIVKFFDPDGNLCAFKDTEKFEIQVNEFTK
ncbi:VOC family protein [Flavobacterium psychrophilum]|nr:VOC family protein [Flavobacterium psychrophilum]